MFTSLLIIGLVTPAYAGKLADGYRDYGWGEMSVPKQIPGASCTPLDPKIGAPWTCKTTLGAVEVSVTPAYDQGRLYGWVISSQGYSNCDTIMDTLTVAYGPSRPSRDFMDKKLDDRWWADGDVQAFWDYNQYSTKCTVVIKNFKESKIVEAANKAAAASGVGDL